MLLRHLRQSMAGRRSGRQEFTRAGLGYNEPSTVQRAESHVKWTELIESWRHGARGARTAREYAVHLPVDDAARLHALAEMFPGRTPEQLITDLLAVALQEVAAAMPYVPGSKVIATDDQGDPIYEDAGPTPRFIELTRSNHKKLKSELKKG
jgi:hypothetical protein